jgi:hypothetical protein
MAQFRYKGEPSNPAVAVIGVVNKFRVPLKNGSKQDLPAPRPEGWLVNDIIAVTDPTSVLALQADPRFEAVLGTYQLGDSPWLIFAH